MTSPSPHPLRTATQIRRSKTMFWGVLGVIALTVMLLAMFNPHVLLIIVEIPVFLIVLFVVGSVLRSSFTTGSS